MKKWIGLLVSITLVALLLSGCNLPTGDSDQGQNNASSNEEQGQAGDDQVNDPDNGSSEGETDSEENLSEGQDLQEAMEATPTSEKPEETPEDEIADGDDLAEFITDVTIPDYSEVETGEEITKTWRIRNAGTTTWTTGYLLEFTKGEKLGASTQIPLPEEVEPGDMVDISIDFTVPTATGEYTSYWIIKNEDNQRIGTTGEGEFFELFMIITAVKDAGGGEGGEGGEGGSSIAGGATISGVTVTVAPTNFSGSCPPNIDIDYTVTTSNAGKVQFSLVFNVISPSGFAFDPPPQYEVDFNSGYTVYYDYLFLPSNSVTATVQVRAVGSNEVLSTPVQFSVNCD